MEVSEATGENKSPLEIAVLVFVSPNNSKFFFLSWHGTIGKDVVMGAKIQDSD